MKRVGIVGASGYSGLELVRYLTNHLEVDLAFASSASFAGRPLSDIYPNLSGIADLVLSEFKVSVAEGCDLVFVALPHGESMKIAGKIHHSGIKVIDLSGDCRLPADIYQKWYGREHIEPGLLESAVYGLTEINRDRIAAAEVIANPGCFPTGIALATIPLLKSGLIAPQLIANSLSGISGAGRAASEAVHFCQASENVTAYKAGGVHQHIPEMERTITNATGQAVTVTFTPHMAPFSRGIFSTIYAPLTNKKTTAAELLGAMNAFYKDEPFIQVLPEGELPQVKSVAGSNFCHLGAAADNRSGQAIIISAIDNLGKGAAGQAVQNMNLMLGLTETLGLTGAGLYP